MNLIYTFVSNTMLDYTGCSVKLQSVYTRAWPCINRYDDVTQLTAEAEASG